jgi:16S rRNA (cytidine1402-2'-O)-methyltransferase
MPVLFIVPTPIGNLEDMTFKAIRILKEADIILAEDTRTSSKLLKYYGIGTPTQAYHQYNEHRLLQTILDKILSGSKAALISDAGTPGISDPGFMLVRECIRNEIRVECLPGPTAFVPALINSGLPLDTFTFEGFLPHKKGRKTRFEELAKLDHTVVLYESPHRLVKTLEQLAEHFGSDCRASVSRELSKIHEETQRGTLAELISYFSTKIIKGEIVIVLSRKT